MDRPNDMQPARAEPIRLTYHDLLALPDDLMRHELIDGEHIVIPAPAPRHQEISGRLFLALGNYLRDHPGGKLYYAPVDIVFSDINVLEPDLLFISNERVSIIQANAVHGAPDLAVEVLSPSTRRHDEVRKRRVYDRFGVREYWIVDQDNRAVRIYRRPENAALALVAELSQGAGSVLESPLFPGFAMSLRDLFE